jgi:hypothetical protein
MISTSIADDLRILDFDNLFQPWLSVSIKDIVIISSNAPGTTYINELTYRRSEHRVFYASGRLLEVHSIKWTILTVRTLTLLVLFCIPKYRWTNLTVLRNVTAFHFDRQVSAAVRWRQTQQFPRNFSYISVKFHDVTTYETVSLYLLPSYAEN